MYCHEKLFVSVLVAFLVGVAIVTVAKQSDTRSGEAVHSLILDRDAKQVCIECADTITLFDQHGRKVVVAVGKRAEANSITTCEYRVGAGDPSQTMFLYRESPPTFDGTIKAYPSWSDGNTYSFDLRSASLLHNEKGEGK